MPSIRTGIAVTLMVASSACSSAGGDGSELLVPYANLSGGIIFATSAIVGSDGYDLYWVPIPDVRGQLNVDFVRLTNASGDEKQPSVARNGRSFAFAGDDGIFLVTFPEGRVSRVSDTSGTTFTDSLPAVSALGDRVAWVREDGEKPIGQSGFFETVIMLANFDGSDARAVAPRQGIVQDAPAFDPRANPLATRLAWTEFAPSSIVPGAGPSVYGVYVHDYVASTGTFVCATENGVTPGTALLPQRGRPYRCFGQHLVWPLESVIVLGQDMLEIGLTGQPLASIWGTAVSSYQKQQLGVPDIGARADGFFPAFPVSLHYNAAVTKIVFDGRVESLQGDRPTQTMFIAETDGSGVFRVSVNGYSADDDSVRTRNHLFSLTTPQFIEF